MTEDGVERPRLSSDRVLDQLPGRIEVAMERAVAGLDQPGVPPQLRAAIHHALFPGGARIRPRLALSAALACGDHDARLADAVAAAVELLHCASLVHDDLPIFDDAPLRRGRPSVHVAFGEQRAVLVGDGLIVLAFEVLARAGGDGARMARVLSTLARGAGAQRGLVAGQAWESEPERELAAYHHAKTAALFESAVEAGAIAGGGDGEGWRPLGRLLGEAYQLADDIADASGDPAALGKPTHQDATHGRTNAHHQLGASLVEERFVDRMQAAVAAIPPCELAPEIAEWVRRAMVRLLPAPIASRLAQRVTVAR